MLLCFGGHGRGCFTSPLPTSGNLGTLMAGGNGLAGATNGKLYALTTTATDTTNGTSSPTKRRIERNRRHQRSATTVSVAALSGALGRATPAFVSTGGGDDTIDATGNVWAALNSPERLGADRMTGRQRRRHLHVRRRRGIERPRSLISSPTSVPAWTASTSYGSRLRASGRRLDPQQRQRPERQRTRGAFRGMANQRQHHLRLREYQRRERNHRRDRHEDPVDGPRFLLSSGNIIHA